MSDEHPAKSSGEFAWAFWSAPIGAFLVTWAFSYPKTCTSEPTSIPPARVPDFSEPITVAPLPRTTCENIFGSPAIFPSEATATLIALAIGGAALAICYAIANR